MPDQFKSFNRTAESIMRFPQIRRHALNELFREIDGLLQYGTRTLLAVTTFIEDNLCYQLSEIAVGSIKSRKIYRGRWVGDRTGIGAGVEIGAENSKILGMGFDLFKLSRTARPVAVPLILKVTRSLRLANITYEHILLAFNSETSDYCEVVERLAVEAGRLQDMEESGEKELVPQMQLVGDLIDRKQQIEASVSCVDPNRLYGTVAIVRQLIRQIRAIQDRIVKAYLRLVPGVVKEWASSDLDALDMFQAGSLGLLHAVSIYDYRSRAGFPSIARTWIRQRVQGSMKASGGPLIRLPFSVWEDYAQIRSTERKLQEANPMEDVRKADVAKKLNVSVDRVEQTLAKVTMSQTLSLDVETSDGEDALTREATIPDESLDLLQELMERREQLLKIMQSLNQEERRLICLRYGFVEGIDNAGIDPKESLREVFHQLSCKTVLQRFLASQLETIRSVPVTEKERK